MIPKVIHYCWFGRNPETDLMKKCILSWKDKLPEYELYLWNEDNFDIASNSYVKEAYETGKWAFVTDYVRLFALYNHGGVYMDTDVEVLKSIDTFLGHKAFTGFENDVHIPTGIMASEQGHPWIKALLDYYTDRHFILADGTLDLTTNVKTVTEISNGFSFDSQVGAQVLETEVYIYPRDYFCPKNWLTKELELTENSYTIHHFDGSWKVKDELSVRILKTVWSLLIALKIDRIFRNSELFIKLKGKNQ